MLSESWSGHITSLTIRVTLYTSRYFVCECTSQSSPRRRLQYLKVHTDCPLHKGNVLSFHPSSVLAAASTIYYRCGWHQGHSLNDNHRTVHAAVDHVGGRGRSLMEHERLVHNQMFDALKSHDRTASYAGDGWVRRLGAMSVVQLLADACRQECPISLFPRGESILRTWAFNIQRHNTQHTTRRGVSLVYRHAYARGGRAKVSPKLRDAAAFSTVVASARTTAAEIAPAWWRK